MIWILTIILAFLPTDLMALGKAYSVALNQQLQIIIIKHPRYVWGGSEDESKGLDCSGYIYLAAKRAGMPIHRTTSLEMARGHGGWIGTDILYTDAKELDFVWWTFKTTREHGHIGILLRSKSGSPAVTHASESRGVVVDEIKESTFRHLSKVRKITLGDSK